MTLFLVKMLPAIYVFARTCIHNEPLKSKTESIFLQVNQLLGDLKCGTMTDNVLRIKKRSIRLAGISFALMIPTILLPVSKFKDSAIGFLAIAFFVSLLVLASIFWLREHRKALKEAVRNPVILGLLFFPTLWYFFADTLILFSKSSQDAELMKKIFTPVLTLSTTEFIIAQLLWSVAITIFLYSVTSILLVPIYFLIFSAIFAVVKLLRLSEKYISNKLSLLDLLVAMLGLVIAGL